MSKKAKFFIPMVLIIAILSLFAVFYFNSATTPSENENLILKSNENRVVLYNGSKIITEYPDIKLETLTDYDRFLLRNGIEITDQEHLRTILEDYSG